MAGVTLPLWQTLTLLGVWVLFCLIPGVWVYRRCRAAGDPTATTWLAVTLFAGPLGVLAWKTDVRVQQRRAAKAGRPYDPNERL
ncbi:MAG TPA: hypothetical protein VNZ52_07405 [Candidatus Thermoplasmatota archaeon]|nr:hypothetical protein [Candidatus Thermoplasmatota archaeon]